VKVAKLPFSFIIKFVLKLNILYACDFHLLLCWQKVFEILTTLSTISVEKKMN